MQIFMEAAATKEILSTPFFKKGEKSDFLK